jgi:hypothetical protein
MVAADADLLGVPLAAVASGATAHPEPSDVAVGLGSWAAWTAADLGEAPLVVAVAAAVATFVYRVVAGAVVNPYLASYATQYSVSSWLEETPQIC